MLLLDYQHLGDDIVRLRNEMLGFLVEIQIQKVLAEDVETYCILNHHLVIVLLLFELFPVVASLLKSLSLLDAESFLDILQALLSVVDAQAVVLDLLLNYCACQACVGDFVLQPQLDLKSQSQFQIVECLLPHGVLLMV